MGEGRRNRHFVHSPFRGKSGSRQKIDTCLSIRGMRDYLSRGLLGPLR
jgi:hypothetical protein